MRKTLTGIVAVSLALGLSACGNDADTTGVKANMGATVGIAMPTKDSERWIDDGKNMVEQFKAMGYQVELQYADNKSDDQVEQVQKMVDRGDKLLVIAAVDGSAFGDVLAKAAKKGIKVIAYDRLLTKTMDVDYQATFDNDRVGAMQAQLLLDRLGVSTGAKGPFNIELFAGSSTDANAHSFYEASMKVLNRYIKNGTIVIRSGQRTFDAVDTENYSYQVARDRMTALDQQYYRNAKLDAVLSPYDGMTRGIIDALAERGYGQGAKKMPITSGQDAELRSVQYIKQGDQTASIYKDTRELAKVAVQMGNAILTGQEPTVNNTERYDNEMKMVPTYLLYPVQVDITNYETLLVRGKYYTEKQIDTPTEPDGSA